MHRRQAAGHAATCSPVRRKTAHYRLHTAVRKGAPACGRQPEHARQLMRYVPVTHKHADFPHRHLPVPGVHQLFRARRMHRCKRRESQTWCLRVHASLGMHAVGLPPHYKHNNTPSRDKQASQFWGLCGEQVLRWVLHGKSCTCGGSYATSNKGIGGGIGGGVLASAGVLHSSIEGWSRLVGIGRGSALGILATRVKLYCCHQACFLCSSAALGHASCSPAVALGTAAGGRNTPVPPILLAWPPVGVTPVRGFQDAASAHTGAWAAVEVHTCPCMAVAAATRAARAC